VLFSLNYQILFVRSSPFNIQAHRNRMSLRNSSPSDIGARTTEDKKMGATLANHHPFCVRKNAQLSVAAQPMHQLTRGGCHLVTCIVFGSVAFQRDPAVSMLSMLFFFGFMTPVGDTCKRALRCGDLLVVGERRHRCGGDGPDPRR
jgi:hypothetical protein